MKKREWSQRKFGHKPWHPGGRGRPPLYEYADELDAEK
jgi:hypothetical protein